MKWCTYYGKKKAVKQVLFTAFLFCDNYNSISDSRYMIAIPAT